MILNKKADVAITILVLGVMALCFLALLSFYLTEKEKQTQKIDFSFYVQEVYNLAESVRFSGPDSIKDYNVKQEGSKLAIERNFEEGNLRIKYSFDFNIE